MTTPAYRVRDWDARYENAQSRKCVTLNWVPVPARHDSERYCELISLENGAEIYTAWILCLQVAARSDRRGWLLRSDGTPHTPETLELKTRGKAEWFRFALPYLAKIGWLIEEKTPLPVGYQSATSGLVARSQSAPGKVGKKEGREADAEKAAKTLTLALHQTRRHRSRPVKGKD